MLQAHPSSTSHTRTPLVDCRSCLGWVEGQPFRPSSIQVRVEVPARHGAQAHAALRRLHTLRLPACGPSLCLCLSEQREKESHVLACLLGVWVQERTLAPLRAALRQGLESGKGEPKRTQSCVSRGRRCSSTLATVGARALKHSSPESTARLCRTALSAKTCILKTSPLSLCNVCSWGTSLHSPAWSPSRDRKIQDPGRFVGGITSLS